MCITQFLLIETTKKDILSHVKYGIKAVCWRACIETNVVVSTANGSRATCNETADPLKS